MAYRNVGNPRFMMNTIEWLSAMGVNIDWTTDTDSGNGLNERFRTDPESGDYEATSITYNGIPEGAFTEKSFIAFLGHNARANTLGFGNSFTSNISVNAELYGGEDFEFAEALSPTWNGFSIRSFDGRDLDATNSFQVSHSSILNSIVIGSYFELSSPDLSLTLSYEYDGIKNIQAQGGSSLSNSMHHTIPNWGDKGAWQLYHTDTIPNLRTGRKIWDLSFSYISSTDLFAVTENYSNVIDPSSEGSYADTDINASGKFAKTILTSEDFFSQCFNRATSGHLPFIFQPDKDNSMPDQFAICKFDMSSLQYEQVAHNTYNVNLKIREVW